MGTESQTNLSLYNNVGVGSSGRRMFYGSTFNIADLSQRLMSITIYDDIIAARLMYNTELSVPRMSI